MRSAAALKSPFVTSTASSATSPVILSSSVSSLDSDVLGPLTSAICQPVPVPACWRRPFGSLLWLDRTRLLLLQKPAGSRAPFIGKTGFPKYRLFLRNLAHNFRRTMTDAQPLTASEFLNRIVGDSSREQTETPDSRAQTATPDDGLEVVDSEEDEESDREYEPEDGGKTPDPETDTDPVSEDEEEPEAEEAGPPYAPAKIEVKDGKIFINGARTPKTSIKKVLLEHESTQPGGAQTWKELKARYVEAKVPGYADLVQAVNTTTPKKSSALSGAAKKPSGTSTVPKKAVATADPKLPVVETTVRSKIPAPTGGLKLSKSKKPTTKKPTTKPKPVEKPVVEPEPEPEPAPEPTPAVAPAVAPDPEPTPAEPVPEPEPVQEPTAPPTARTKRLADADADATTLEEMRVTIDRYNEKLRPLGAEFTLVPTKALRLA